ncbi:MAG: thioredoxin reductase (NADPH) [Woeseiaceae bacterium]
MIKTDVVIIGAGPCGLFQVFELGLLGLKCEVIDSIRSPGGQCTELYPDKPIYDIPAIPICTGQELTEALLQQIEPFDYGMTLNDEVIALEKLAENNFLIETNAGKKFQSKAVVIAGGVGSFQPRQLRANNVEQFSNESLHYSVKDSSVFQNKHLAILGGGDSALDWVLDLVKIASEITLIHRRDEFRAVPASVSKMRQLYSEGKINLIENAKVTDLIGEKNQLTSCRIETKDGMERDIKIDNILVFFGLAPKLGPIADWGLNINRKTINVDTEKFQTSESGIFAVGDINFYPGKKKLILSGFHEAALAAFAIKQQLEPNKKVHLQYTTTSSIMHERLGVNE